MTPATAQPHVTAPEDRVPWRLLIAYGMGGIVPVALFNIAGQLMGLLGNISLGLSAFWLGTIMIVPRLWDAVSDPIMGHISDNTRSRWGRRRPYILLGGIAVAVTFAAIWWVPRGDWARDQFASQSAFNWFQLAYILGGMLAFYTATTIFEIPHGALGMEMSGDYHERTRLFSAKSFLGNLFAMGTPWLIALAELDFFAGPGGDLTDGMRYVSLLIGALLVPLSLWWFFALREPAFELARSQQRSEFWRDMRATVQNKAFVMLVFIIFTLAMGFNFVQIFNYYITIFYLYRGSTAAAGLLLGIAGTTWAVTALIAVFPLNWLSRRIGKNRALLIAILLMCAAQLAKIVCYDSEFPYLVLVPTVLLSAGMLMFFTLGAAMIGDVCDEDELRTGTRSEGSFYSVYWWFIKLGTAFASFVMGALLVFTGFDERQNVLVNELRGHFDTIKSDADGWDAQRTTMQARDEQFTRSLGSAIESAQMLKEHLAERAEQRPDQAKHIGHLVKTNDEILSRAQALRGQGDGLIRSPQALIDEALSLVQEADSLKQQAPKTLFRLRLVEIGLPLALSCVSIFLTLRYPLTEARCYEIKQALEKRRGELALRASELS